MKVWKRKSAEHGLNQKEAADLLGWTRGALCQYLNGHTKINPEALIKLANFFEVDPRELDPAIEHFLPSVKKLTVAHNLSDPKTTLKDASIMMLDDASTTNEKACAIAIDEPISWQSANGTNTIVDGWLICSKTPNKAHVKDESLWVIQRKGEQNPRFEIVRNTELPLARTLSKKLLLVRIAVATGV